MGFTLDLFAEEPFAIEGITVAEARELAQRRCDALAQTGRIELDSSAMQTLGTVLLTEFGEFAPDAIEAFYELRDELPASAPDVEIIDALSAAMRRVGGDVESLDIPELSRALRAKDDTMSYYSITDGAGYTYRWDPRRWGCDEQAPGWDGERWEDDYDE